MPTTVRHYPVKIPGLSDLPWLLAKPRAPGLAVSLVSYLSTLHDSRVNSSAGAVLWTRGEKIAWARPNDAATAVLTGRRLDGAGAFTLSLEPTGTVFFAKLRFPSAGCWRLTLEGAATTSAVVVRAVPPPSASTCAATRVTAGERAVATPASAGIWGIWSWTTRDGRALLYAGGRSPSGTNMKVPWYVRRAGGRALTVIGRRIDGPGSFRQTFPKAVMQRGVYPSAILVPTAGCWSLTVRTGRLAGVLVVRVVDRRPPGARGARARPPGARGSSPGGR